MTNECDLNGDTCPVPGLESNLGVTRQQSAGPEFIYIGDPLCSWCWAAAPVVAALPDYCTGERIKFSIVVGGLRPRAGTAWTDQFKAFLLHHWQEVAARTGQPFSGEILKREHFNYCTEPPCRAVVAARGLLASDQNSRGLSAFFAAIQHKFYVDGEDPAEPGFYSDICTACGLDYTTFLKAFDDATIREQTLGDFQISRDLGVSGFPSFVLRHGGSHEIIAAGFVPLEELIARIERALGKGEVA